MTPSAYDTRPTMMPTIVISRPLDHQLRTVMRLFAAPTAKCANKLTIAAATMAGRPLKKKNGTSGIIPPTNVDKLPNKADFHGFPRPSS